MKNALKILSICFLLNSALFACSSVQEFETEPLVSYVPVDQLLHDTIVAMDKKFFDAYNNCNLDVQAAIISEDLEFYHDSGGLLTSKKVLLDALEKNICGKVTRNLVEGSIEVTPIPGYGAVQMGLHTFFNKQVPDAPMKPGKFVTIWKNENEQWTITRVISLH